MARAFAAIVTCYSEALWGIILKEVLCCVRQCLAQVNSDNSYGVEKEWLQLAATPRFGPCLCAFALAFALLLQLAVLASFGPCPCDCRSGNTHACPGEASATEGLG